MLPRTRRQTLYFQTAPVRLHFLLLLLLLLLADTCAAANRLTYTNEKQTRLCTGGTTRRRV